LNKAAIFKLLNKIWKNSLSNCKKSQKLNKSRVEIYLANKQQSFVCNINSMGVKEGKSKIGIKKISKDAFQK